MVTTCFMRKMRPVRYSTVSLIGFPRKSRCTRDEILKIKRTSSNDVNRFRAAFSKKSDGRALSPDNDTSRLSDTSSRSSAVSEVKSSVSSSFRCSSNTLSDVSPSRPPVVVSWFPASESSVRRRHIDSPLICVSRFSSRLSRRSGDPSPNPSISVMRFSPKSATLRLGGPQKPGQVPRRFPRTLRSKSESNAPIASIDVRLFLASRTFSRRGNFWRKPTDVSPRLSKANEANAMPPVVARPRFDSPQRISSAVASLSGTSPSSSSAPPAAGAAAAAGGA
mmetsp:Transcript_21050/g.62669  ORF Transcript_21050/g.62669 Transcript_21050/m.62669 type:complete len:279 (-) Transcript_21050:104-940(-)